MRLQARKIYKGKARGEVLAVHQPLSLLGGVDRESGEITDETTGLRGVPVTAKVLVFPRGKGSTAGSYVLYTLKARGQAPAALVCQRAETVVATGAIIGEIPMVDQVQTDLFRTGDVVTVDADEGFVEIEGMEVSQVVTAFLSHGGDVLILRRSEDVKSFPGLWAGVSGYLEEGEEAVERARIEVREETGLEVPEEGTSGDLILARGREGNTIWVVHPFLFQVDSRDITLDWEHVEYQWIKPEELGDYLTVPKLAETLESALRSVRRPSAGR